MTKNTNNFVTRITQRVNELKNKKRDLEFLEEVSRRISEVFSKPDTKLTKEIDTLFKIGRP